MRRRPSPPDRGAARLRREARRANRRKPDLGGLLRAACLVVLGAQCLRVAFASPRLQLKEVRVEGTARLSAQQVSERAALDLGENIFRVNLIRLRDTLLQDPEVREAVVTRELPHTISVHVVDRTPEYQVAAAGVRYDVDADDVVFRRARRYVLGRPVLEVPPGHVPPLGQKLRAQYAAAARDCAEQARLNRLDLRNMRVDGAGELWLGIATAAAPEAAPPPGGQAGATPAAGAGKLKVRVGRMTDLPEKFRDIRISLRGLPGLSASATHLDVMCPGRPAYLKAEPPQTP